MWPVASSYAEEQASKIIDRPSPSLGFVRIDSAHLTDISDRLTGFVSIIFLDKLCCGYFFSNKISLS